MYRVCFSHIVSRKLCKVISTFEAFTYLGSISHISVSHKNSLVAVAFSEQCLVKVRPFLFFISINLHINWFYKNAFSVIKMVSFFIFQSALERDVICPHNTMQQKFCIKAYRLHFFFSAQIYVTAVWAIKWSVKVSSCLLSFISFYFPCFFLLLERTSLFTLWVRLHVVIGSNL